jgi:predicted AAA+ superfamily ATPase
MVYPKHEYVSLEALHLREEAIADPIGFLKRLGDRAIIDEVQRAPDLLSYIQVAVDENRLMGQYVLTGSANFALLSTISQSLAGRTAVFHLYPCTLDELRRFPESPEELDEAVFMGGYPALFDRGMPCFEWFEAYISTFVERDLRQFLNVGNLVAFQQFMSLCAGRSGQLVNFSDLGRDVGVAYQTIKSWLSVLETGFLTFRLLPWFRNLAKRQVRAPKLHFYDSGLVCALLGIQSPDQLRNHPLRGSIFEGWVVSEIRKSLSHRGFATPLYFYGEHQKAEVDLVMEQANRISAIEIKAGQTINRDFFRGLDSLGEKVERHCKGYEFERFLIYGGDKGYRRQSTLILPWTDVAKTRWS